MLTLDQKRAQIALDYVKAFHEKNQADRSRLVEHRKRLESMPTMLAINGLLPALLHLESDNKPVATCLVEWLADCGTFRWSVAKDQLRAQLVKVEADIYWQASEESLKLATWIKRWAQALLPKT